MTRVIIKRYIEIEVDVWCDVSGDNEVSVLEIHQHKDYLKKLEESLAIKLEGEDKLIEQAVQAADEIDAEAGRYRKAGRED